MYKVMLFNFTLLLTKAFESCVVLATPLSSHVGANIFKSLVIQLFLLSLS